MTATRPPQTRDEFRTRIEALVRGAEANGVDIEGSYVLQSTHDRYDWDLELVQLIS